MPREQIAADGDADHRHEDAEDLRREGDLVLRIMEEVEVEGEGEARPDIVAERVGQDEADHDQHAPAEALAKLAERSDQRDIKVVERRSAARLWVAFALEHIALAPSAS